MNIEKLIQTFQENAIPYLGKILLALIVLFIGFRVIKWITNFVTRLMERQNYDESLRSFLGSLLNITLKIALLLTVASTLGIETTSFVALLGAAGLAIGIALQGSLANFAGGVMLLLFKPFKIGDFIKAQDAEGFVREIQIFTTKLVTADDVTIYVPNGPLASGNIQNFSQQGKTRISIPVGIAYDANIQDARNKLLNVIFNHPKVLEEPLPDVIVTELADSSVNLAVRAWCLPNDVPAVTADLTEMVKTTLDSAGIEIPFPQQVLHQK